VVAHLLAAGADGFGVPCIARAGRRFESAADAGASEIAALAKQLAQAIDAAAPIMPREIAAPGQIPNPVA